MRKDIQIIKILLAIPRTTYISWDNAALLMLQKREQ
jgi:hypothetical protein